MHQFMSGGESPSLISVRDGKVFVRIPVVMYGPRGREVIGMADVVCRNEDERIKFSSSEIIADAFDARQDEGQEEGSLKF